MLCRSGKIAAGAGGLSEANEALGDALSVVVGFKKSQGLPVQHVGALVVTPFLPEGGQTAGAVGDCDLVSLEVGLVPTAKLSISGSGATINSVRVEIAQRLKRNFPTLANVVWD